jgi:hypothetical protein
MYGARYGTDWTSLAHDEVVERAFALGVAAALGEVDTEEYDRLEAEFDGYDAYDRSLVELAYREGKSEALDLRRGGDATASVWEELVEDGIDTVVRAPPDPPGPTTNGPPSVVDRVRSLDRPSFTDLPEFLGGRR